MLKQKGNQWFINVDEITTTRNKGILLPFHNFFANTFFSTIFKKRFLRLLTFRNILLTTINSYNSLNEKWRIAFVQHLKWINIFCSSFQVHLTEQSKWMLEQTFLRAISWEPKKTERDYTREYTQKQQWISETEYTIKLINRGGQIRH